MAEKEKAVVPEIIDSVEALEAKMKAMREAQKNLLDAEERILSAEYDTKMCEISLLQISGKVMAYFE